ncbi:MAG: hypothetical protein LLG20_13815, partial [Acidobacteriales bacterium]|nr:hypothetical protein [Terriglobales bacterium]
MSVTAESVKSPSYFRLQVARGHLGRGHTEYEARYVSTFMPVADLYANHGKAIAGIKRVTALSPVTRD